MTDQPAEIPAPTFKDRKASLVAFGIIEILIGALCLLFVPLMVFGMKMTDEVARKAGQPPMNARTIIPGVLVYLMMAAWFVCMGIGSIRARRWARALMLVTSWMWLCGGMVGLVAMVFIMPAILHSTATGGGPGGMEMILYVFTFGTLALIYTIIPSAFILFYRSRHVKATCEHCDPTVRWTDQCPLPVLALSLLYGYAACWLPFMGLRHWALPFFGFILSGLPGALVAIAGTGLCAYLAWGTYRLKMTAWWVAAALAVGWCCSSIITFSRVALLDFYAYMDIPAEQLAVVEKILPGQRAIVALCLVWVLLFLAYLIFTRRFFTKPAGG